MNKYSPDPASSQTSFAAKFVDALWVVMEDRDARHRLARTLVKRFRQVLMGSVLVYGFGLLVLVFLMKQVGERNLTTAFFLYLPPAIWFPPLVALGGLGLLFYRKALLVALLLGALAFLQFFGWQFGGGDRSEQQGASSSDNRSGAAKRSHLPVDELRLFLVAKTTENKTNETKKKAPECRIQSTRSA